MRLPKYRPHKGRARVQWQGKRFYLPGPFNSAESQAAFQRLIDQIQLDAIADNRAKENRATPSQLKAITVNELILRFLGHAKKYYRGDDGKPTTEYNHFLQVAKILKKRCGNIPVAEFGPMALKTVREDMIRGDEQATPPRPAWSRKRVNRQVGRLRQLYKYGVAEEIAPAENLLALQAVPALRAGKSDAEETADVRPVSWETAELLKPYVCPLIWHMIELQYLTGMRSGELTRLRAVEIDMSSDVWVFNPEKHKTAHRGKKKFVCFGPRAIEILQKYLTTKLHAYLFSPGEAMRQRFQQRAADRTSPLYGKAKNRPPSNRKYADRYTTDTYRKAIQFGFDKIDRQRMKEGLDLMERWHPHQLRHSRATETRVNYGLEGSAAQLGNTLQAADIYAERSIELAKSIARETG